MIANERSEQISKHGFSIEQDAWNAKDISRAERGPLMYAAVFALTGKPWPEDWDGAYANKIRNQTYKEPLIVAGALLAAEIDRLEYLESNLSGI